MSDYNEQTRMDDDGNTGRAVALTSPEDLIGRVLRGAFRVEAKIGAGGMGMVFKGTQLNLGRPVAIKVIHVENRSPVGEERFNREAKLLSRLQHPNVVSLIDFGCDPGPLHYMVMEYLAGEPLDAFVKGRGSLSYDFVFDVLAQVASAVAAAHQMQIVHRDLKPANILLTQVTGDPRPVVKVLDFGLAKVMSEEKHGTGLTREGVVMGTLGYSAPEQLTGSAVDARADIYSLGAILYYMLCGLVPYRGDGMQTTLLKQMTRPPEPLPVTLDLPRREQVTAVILRAMSPVAADRHPSAEAFLNDLSAAFFGTDEEPTPMPARGMRSGAVRLPASLRPGDGGPPSTVRTPSPDPTHAGAASEPTTAWQMPRPTRRGVVAALGVALLGAAGTYLATRRRDQAPPDPENGATAPGVTSGEIVLGMCGPFTGPTQALGRSMRDGMEAMFRTANDDGVFGRKVRLVCLDDEYEPERTAEKMRELIEKHNVFAFVGNVGTPTSAAAVPLAVKAGRVFFGAYSGASLLREDPPSRHVFNYRASYAEEMEAVVEYLVKIRRVKPADIAVFTQDDSYGDDGFHGAAKALRKYDIPEGDIFRVKYERNTIAVKDAVEQVAARRNSIGAIAMVATYLPASEFIVGIRNAGVKAVATNVSFVGSEALALALKLHGPQYAEGVIVTQVVPHYASNATGVLRFRDALKRHFPEASPSFVSLEGYVAARVFLEGLKNAGRRLTTDSLVEGLEKIHDLDLAIGTKIRFGPSDHQASDRVWGTVLDKHGHYSTLDLT